MLYIVGIPIEEIKSIGVRSKINSQVDAFNRAGMGCKIVVLNLDDENNWKTKIKRIIPFINMRKKWSIEEMVDQDYIYIRKGWESDRYANKFYTKLKKLNPKLKIVYEVPTYPYDAELSDSWKGRILLLKDRWYRRQFPSFIDRIATLTDDKEIFGVPTLKICNGIDLEKIRPRNVRDLPDIHAIAVANFEWWHGYDRFLEGMKVYYAANPLRKIIFHLVGYGNELDRYQKMVEDYGLGEYVILHGRQTGEALDAIYDQCNLGIASLGCYRKGMNETQELKSREYLAKGVPFVSGVKITDIPDVDKDNIYLQVPNNDSPVNIEMVLNFYDRIYREGADQVSMRLRQFAKDHFSMEVAMKEVIDFFQNGK